MTTYRIPHTQEGERGLSVCDRDPIHMPGAIQPHGAVVAALSDGLLITHASANLASILGCGAEAMLGHPLQEAIGETICRLVRDAEPTDQAALRWLHTLPGPNGSDLHLQAHVSGQHICLDIEPVHPDPAQRPPITMLQSVLESFEIASSPVELCERAVCGLKAITGYDRVMAYRFSDDGHGEVIAETCAAGLPAYLGQHYPASDIPVQARRQYRRQRVGVIVDSSYEPVPLLFDPALHDGTSLDLTHCALRSVSHFHRAYMRNMNTAASLTIGLAQGNSLWGMLVCHHTTTRAAGPELRALADMLGRVVSLLLFGLGETEAQSRRLSDNNTLLTLTERLATPGPLLQALATAESDLLRLVGADGALISISGTVRYLGHTPPPIAAERALMVLSAEAGGQVLALDELGKDHPELADCVSKSAGVLLLPLAQGTSDAILWCRPEQSRTVIWGGNPALYVVSDPVTGQLSPRASFAAWKDLVRGRSAPWKEADLGNAEKFGNTVKARVALDLKAELRRNVEKHLVETEARYRGLLEAAPDAMVVVNQDGDIVLLNIRAEAQFGYVRDELLGKKVTAIIPEGFAERLIADGLRPAAEALAQQIGMGIELYGRRKDGSDFPVEIMLSPLESPEGILVTAAIRDITARKNAENHLAETEARYRGLLEAAPDAMVVVNQDGDIVLLNIRAEAQFGYVRDELLGQKVTVIIPEGFAERLIADGLRPAAEALAQQIGMGIELYGRRKDGSDFPVEIMLSPLESPEGILVTAAVRDISARKNAEAHSRELSRSNVELEQFAYIASHDLQEPLRMVTSYTQLLSKRYKGKLDSDADEFIAFAVDGACRMQKLIQDLLAYSHVGTKGIDLVEISSEHALQKALANLRDTIETSAARITHDPIPVVLADEIQLIQLFQNLIGNAIKYQAGASPAVHVAATRNGGGRWMFSVRDNGLGIDPQYFEKIFGMFQRLHRRDEFAGTGIGLAICKKIVERHGGTISVESKLGHGSVFRFSLAGDTGKS